MNWTKKELQEIFESLPEDIQLAMFSPETAESYNKVREHYGLNDEQRVEISTQTDLLMMGLTSPKEFVPALAEKLRVPRDKAAFIAQEVNREVLHKVRESLKEIHGLTSTQSVAPGTKTNIASQVSVPKANIPPTIPKPTPTIPLPPKPPVVVHEEVVTPQKSAVDQKLGGQFRMAPPPEAPLGVPTYAQVQPPPPQIPPQPPLQKNTDPYRELPL